MDYIINFTDPAKSSFVIKPMTTNGPLTPANAVPLDPNATSANTSLVLLGKGMWEYGERVAEDLVHMVEHFAYDTSPAYPIQGQLWFDNNALTVGGAGQGLFVYDGTAWQPIVIGSSPIVGDLDMGGFTIYNAADPLPGAGNFPVGGDDVLIDRAYADARYVNLAGDTMTGTLIVPALTVTGTNINMSSLPIINLLDPVNPQDAATKTYVDTLVSTTASNYVLKAGDTMTGLLIASGGITISGVGAFTYSTAGIFDMGAQRIQNMADPIVNQDAATKFYVDTAVSGGGIPPEVLIDGPGPGNGFDPILHTITVQRYDLAPYTVATGVAGIFEIWPTSSSRQPLDPTYNSSYLREQFVDNALYPNNVPFDQVVNAMDQALYATTAVAKRQISQGDGVQTTFLLDFDYLTYSNKLQVYNNGVKQYASQRGQFVFDIEAPQVNIGTDTGLAAIIYDFDILVDQDDYATNAVNVSVNLTTYTLPIKYSNLLTEINAGLVGAGVLATAQFRDGRISFFSDAQGSASLVFIDATSGTVPLFVPPLGVTAGFQVVNVGNLKTGASPTGLANDATVYTGSITVDGGAPQPLTVTGSAAQTYTTLITELGLDTVGATWSLVAGNLRLTSNTTGVLSAVTIVNTGAFPLFASLLGTIEAAVAGAASTIAPMPFGSTVAITAANTGPDTFEVAGDYTLSFPTGALFTVYGSTGNDDGYQVIAPGATFAAGVTTIPVTTVSSAVADGDIVFWRDLAYEEDGTPFSPTTLGSQIDFLVAPAAGSVLEIITFP